MRATTSTARRCGARRLAERGSAAKRAEEASSRVKTLLEEVRREESTTAAAVLALRLRATRTPLGGWADLPLLYGARAK